MTSLEQGRDGVNAFDEFYRCHRDQAVRLAWLLTHDASAAEDIAHDAFAAIFDRYSATENPSAYLRRCVVNGVFERSRRLERERRRNRLVIAAVPSAADGPTGGVLDAVSGLSVNQRTAVVLRYWSGLGEREIAEAMGVRVGTVKSTLNRAIAKLRKELLP